MQKLTMRRPRSSITCKDTLPDRIWDAHKAALTGAKAALLQGPALCALGCSLIVDDIGRFES